MAQSYCISLSIKLKCVTYIKKNREMRKMEKQRKKIQIILVFPANKIAFIDLIWNSQGNWFNFHSHFTLDAQMK